MMQKRAKNEVFGHFLDLGDSDRLEIAYDGSAKCFSTCGSGFRSCMINLVCIMCINCAKKEQKMRFLAIFSSLGSRYDLLSHMMGIENVSQHVAVVIGHA